jgi:uncharacterized coiled-coil DUF342 family protein
VDASILIDSDRQALIQRDEQAMRREAHLQAGATHIDAVELENNNLRSEVQRVSLVYGNAVEQLEKLEESHDRARDHIEKVESEYNAAIEQLRQVEHELHRVSEEFAHLEEAHLRVTETEGTNESTPERTEKGSPRSDPEDQENTEPS